MVRKGDALDDKFGGFAWEDSHLVDLQQVDHLLLAMVVATIYRVSIGVETVEQGLRKIFDPHTRRGLSYSQIELRSIQSRLAREHRIRLRLGLNPDPGPVSHYEIPFPFSAVSLGYPATEPAEF